MEQPAIRGDDHPCFCFPAYAIRWPLRGEYGIEFNERNPVQLSCERSMLPDHGGSYSPT